MDLRAQQVIEAALESDLLVPDEVAILGINNDLNRCELSYPPLSSVAANSFQSGYRAAEVLGGMLAGKKLGTVDERIEPLGVITRRSTDVLAIADRTVASALGFIRERACQNISVDEVVVCPPPPQSAGAKIVDHLGRTLQAEIRRVQVAKIRQLLQETDFPLKKIADLAGFEHVEYMCVLFKRLTGTSPGVFRKQATSVFLNSGRDIRPWEASPPSNWPISPTAKFLKQDVSDLIFLMRIDHYANRSGRPPSGMV